MSPRKPVSATANRIYKSSTPKIQTKLTTPRTIVKKHLTYGKKSSVKSKTLTQMWEWGKLKDSWSDEQKSLSRNKVQNQDDVNFQKNKEGNVTLSKNEDKRINPAISKKRTVQKRKVTSNIDTEFSNAQSYKSSGINLGKKTGHGNLVKPQLRTQVLAGTNKSSTPESEHSQSDENDNISEDYSSLHDKSRSLMSSHRPCNDENSLRHSQRPKKFSLTPKKSFLRAIQTPQTPSCYPSLEVPSSQSPATPMSLPTQRSDVNCQNLSEIFSKSPSSVCVKRKLNFSPRKSLSPIVRDTFDNSLSPSPNIEKLSHLKNVESTGKNIQYYSPGRAFCTPSRRSISCNLVTSPSINLRQNTQASYIHIVTKDSPLRRSSQKSALKLKIEILDSEAETDEEFETPEIEEVIEEIRLNKHMPHKTFDKQKLIPPIPANNKATLNYEQSKSATGESSKSGQDTMDEYNETLGPQTLVELENIMASNPSLKVANKGKQKIEWEVLPAVSKFKDSPKATQQGILPSKETQSFTTQRLSTQYLGQMAPRTSESDIFMSIDPQRVAEIINRSRDHETRRYKLPPSVCRAWLYERSPISTVKYMAEISPAKRPGQIVDETGIGNKAFNLKSSASPWTAYEILQLYELANPITLKELKEKEWLKNAPKPMKWTKIPPAVVDELIANIKSPLFSSVSDTFSSMTPISRPLDIQETNFHELEIIPQLTGSNFSIQHGADQFINSDIIKPQRIPSNESTPRRRVRASSQATTVDLTEEETPKNRLVTNTSWETPVQTGVSSTPSTVSIPFSMASSIVLTRSQLLPESLLNDFTSIPLSLPSSDHDTNI